MSAILLDGLPTALECDWPLAAATLPRLASWQARPGEVLTVRDDAGGCYRGRLLPDGRGVRLFARIASEVEPRHARCLVQALPDRERMLLIIQKAVELGATRIQPVLTRHGAPLPGAGPGQDKSATWSRVALAAAKQCRRAVIPEVAPPMMLTAFLEANGAAMVHMDLTGEPLLALAPALARAPLAVLVGPEGGWGEGERAALRAAGSRPVTLGVRVLRTETAGIAALAVLAAMDADFT